MDDTLKNLSAATTLSSANYAGYIPTDNFGKDLADQVNSLKGGVKLGADQLLDFVLGGFSDLSGKLAYKTPDFGVNKVEGDDDDDGIIRKLIKLIKGIITIPIRFINMSQALLRGTIALTVGIEGLAKSAILGTKDIITLILAIIKILAKYFLCILSFIITTIAGCFLIHGITFMFCVLYLIFPATGYFIEMGTGYDIMPQVDYMFEILNQIDEHVEQYTGFYVLRWPDTIQSICYSCFGVPVKLRDVLLDVQIIKDIGDQITHDFTKVIPVYMRPSAPHGAAAMKHLNLAFN